MAKGILEFDLNDFDDKMAHLRAVKSLDMSLFIFQLIYNTKKSIMYELENKELKDWEVVNLVFERIHELLDEHGINMDELVN